GEIAREQIGGYRRGCQMLAQAVVKIAADGCALAPAYLKKLRLQLRALSDDLLECRRALPDPLVHLAQQGDERMQHEDDEKIHEEINRPVPSRDIWMAIA